jgi:hypothetical protein
VRNYLKNKIKTKRSQPQWLMPIILAPQEVIGRIAEVQGQSWQNSLEIPSQTIKAGMVACTCHLSYVGSVTRRISVQICPGTNVRTYSKNN